MRSGDSTRVTGVPELTWCYNRNICGVLKTELRFGWMGYTVGDLRTSLGHGEVCIGVLVRCYMECNSVTLVSIATGSLSSTLAFPTTASVIPSSLSSYPASLLHSVQPCTGTLLRL